MISSRTIALAGALLAMPMGSMVFSQDQSQQQMPMGPGMMGYGPMMEGRLAYLKAELGITDQQTDAWNAYVSAVKARAAAMQSNHTRMTQAMQSGTAVGRMKAHTEVMQSMVESMKAITLAVETLYTVLTDDQKKKADLLLGSGCCMM